MDNQYLEPLIEIFRMSYFSRVWIVQEFLNATSLLVQCGLAIPLAREKELHYFPLAIIEAGWTIEDDDSGYSKAVPGASQEALKHLRSCTGMKLIQERSRRYILRGMQHEQEPAEFARVLFHCNHSRCSDPHYHIYALLAVTGHEAHVYINVD